MGWANGYLICRGLIVVEDCRRLKKRKDGTNYTRGIYKKKKFFRIYQELDEFIELNQTHHFDQTN